MTHLCVAIFVHDLNKARRDIALAAEFGADIIELRIDRFHDAEAVRSLIEASRVPVIVTCRSVAEGGHCALSDAQRVRILDRAASDGAAYIDLELRTLRSLPAAADAGLPRRWIVSAHDFAGRPERLYNLVGEMNASAADVVKIVWTARTIRDNLEAFEVLQNRTRPTIALCMGEAGLISRVLARKFGGFLTFASLDSDPGTAPGQIPVSDMKRLYRWDAIGPRTRVYGVVASPVKHSMSPAIHNAAFDATGHDGVYLPLLVEPSYESFKAFMQTFVHFPGLDLSGLSVTIPHKQNALRYLEEQQAEVEPLARAIGAVNTIAIDHSGPTPRLRGFNTDYAAILDSITAALGIEREALRGRAVAVLGAGGTGRTAVAALTHYGAHVTVYNRTKNRADELAGEFDGRGAPVRAATLDQVGDCDCAILINTTSVGMHPNVNDSPLDPRPPRLGSDTLVFDAVYNPPRTKLLAQAEAAGARTVGGVEMFLRQAVAQFEAWTGLSAPVAVMRQVIESRLRP